jgi:shikimate dehydrogenase
MVDRYAVVGNPIAHSRSPQIHTAFAQATGQNVEYTRLLAPLDGFAATVAAFRVSGGRGLNVTLPFKAEAFRLADHCSDRANRAEAVNTLRFDGDRTYGDNTDGVGMVRDITVNLGIPIEGRRVLLVGAGGAAQGVIPALLDAHPSAIVVVNRTLARAEAMTMQFGERVHAAGFTTLPAESFDIIINATSAGLAGDVPPLSPAVCTGAVLAYDMMYGKHETPFLAYARQAGAQRTADGLGMLVEQAAESFYLWRGMRPDTVPVLALLRASS